MKRYKGYIRTDRIGSDCEFEFDVDDDATEEEIQAEARDAAFQYIDWHFEEIK